MEPKTDRHRYGLGIEPRTDARRIAASSCASSKSRTALRRDLRAYDRRRRTDARQPQLVDGARRADVQQAPHRRGVGEMRGAHLDEDDVVELEPLHLIDLRDLDAG